MNKMVRELNEQKLEGFVARILDDLGATMIAPLVRIGDELGLYSALAETGPVTPEELARRTGTVERLVREWLSAHAAAGYLDYDAATKRFAMNPEQAMVFGNPDSPVYMLGSFEVCQAVMVDQPKVSKAFRNGGAAGYHERCNCLFSGMSRFFGVSYKAHLVQEWLPALDGVVEKLDARCAGRRYRLRPWHLHHSHGESLRKIEIFRDRQPRRIRSPAPATRRSATASQPGPNLMSPRPRIS